VWWSPLSDDYAFRMMTQNSADLLQKEGNIIMEGSVNPFCLKKCLVGQLYNTVIFSSSFIIS
jgi:hypothetical protein